MSKPDKTIFRDAIIIGLVFWLPLLVVFGWFAYWPSSALTTFDSEFGAEKRAVAEPTLKAMLPP